jgi:TonB-linked SusC/RagA family outer membrane protein
MFLLSFLNGNLIYGQTKTVTITQKDITVRAALLELEKQTGYSIGYDEKVLNADAKIPFHIQNEPVENVLTLILKDSGCDYAILNNHIIISRKTPEVTKTKISGKITDNKGEALIGASITVAGENEGTASDVDGNFTLQLGNPNANLVVQYLGYTTRQIVLDGKNYVVVIMQEDNRLLEEVVVIGYGSIKKRDLTTAVSVISTEDIDERPVVSAAQVLQGKATGVQVVQPSGEPGGTISIRVRGATSIQAGNEPLYVVDGIPMTSLMNLNPNDVESMQILKDASSAAIYGTRGANGVVIITTKRGKTDARNITFNSYYGSSWLGKKIDALNTEQYKDLIKDLNQHAQTTLSIPDDETRYTNWTDEFFKTGHNQNYQLSIANGSEKLKYYLSLGYISDQGIVEKAKYDRYNLRANIDSRQTDWLNIGLNLGYSQSIGSYVRHSSSSMRSGSVLSVINTPPYMQVWDENNPGQYDEFAYGSRILHPIAATAADRIFTESNIIGSLNLDFLISKQLQYKLHFGIDETNGKSKYYLDPFSNSDGRFVKGEIEESYNRNMEWLWENMLTYENTFNKQHHLSLLGGTVLQKAVAEGASAAGHDLLNDSRYLNGANIINKESVSSSLSEWTLASFLGRVSYDFESRYLFSANVRADGSSKFSPGYKWGVFPSLSAAWRISSESFMKSVSNILNDLKIRAGWGLNGNQGGLSNYAWVTRYNFSRVEPTTDKPLPGMAISQANIGNKSLTWETTSQTNIGLDVSLFNSRLNLTLDAYYKYTKDMLMTVYLPAVVAPIQSIQRNDGEMRNKGLEIGISSKNLTGTFQWNTDFNISFNDNLLTKTKLSAATYWGGTATNQQPIILKEGLPLGAFYGYVSKGVDPDTGDIIYEDIDPNGVIDAEDRKVIGYAQPKFTGGITNNFSYAGFDLSVFFQGSYGNDIFNASKIDMTGMMDFRNQSTDVLRRWREPGMQTDIPRPGQIANIHNSTRFIEDGSYLRLKSLTLAYNFDTQKTFFKKCGISKLQPYITAQNLWTLTRYSGYDPEVNAFGKSAIELGIDYGTYPQSKALIVGINVQF